jgi:anti-anti-sigma factor
VTHHLKRQSFTDGTTIVNSSRTPEELPASCPVCGSNLKIEPSDPARDAPCHRCGHLLWFTWEDLGDIEVIKPIEHMLRAESLDRFLDSVVIRPGTQIVLDLTKVRFFSSAAFAKLINFKSRVGCVGGRFSIRNLHPDVREAMQITHMDHVFDVEA